MPLIRTRTSPQLGKTSLGELLRNIPRSFSLAIVLFPTATPSSRSKVRLSNLIALTLSMNLSLSQGTLNNTLLRRYEERARNAADVDINRRQKNKKGGGQTQTVQL